MSDDDLKARQRLYAETRKDLLTRQLSNSERYDGAILTLSTGVLGLSLAFIKDIASVCTAHDLILLTMSWWMFGLAIISTLTSFLASQLGIKRQLFYAERYYLYEEDEYLVKPNIPARATDVINYISGLSFIAAILLTIVFVSANLGGNTSMTNETKTSLAPCGAIIPSMQSVYPSNLDKKGAPIPNMQPVPSSPAQSGTGSTGTGQSSPSTTGQNKSE
ncbi:MAG: hypothetical protein HY273_04345 [Gammaproteobacteria bacterium]|nr:hypothetical protein [Gammaproteobacteria bacterium]